MELKKFVAAAAVGVGFLMVGTPAFAGGEYDHTVRVSDFEYEHNHQVGLVNMNESDILSDINLCHLDVNVIAIPLLSGNDSGSCVNSEIDD
ncbi:hypothetical protein SAMN05216553_10547 [Lentzea fradiae]|uniref:Small secreted domain n=1 Tax=Lentzea fradiae TaxID=200378 RepID=A0A1G7R130_9PSEU|nr:hypothetical protein [Lentzea fradiae]SDG04437.1 hypothetical protein SAMN05216553_10547 [Lentzea fradiae]